MISWEGKNGCKNHFSSPQTVAEFLWGCSHLVPSFPLGLLARSVPRSAPAWQLCVFPVTMATLPGPPGHRAGGPSHGEVSMGKANVGNTPQVWNFHPGEGWGGTGGSPSFNPHQESPKGRGTAQGDQCAGVLGSAHLFLLPCLSPLLFLSLPSALKITAHKQSKILKMAAALRLHKINPGSSALFVI